MNLLQKVSSQCSFSCHPSAPTLGSRYKNTCKLYNEQWILVSYVENNVCDEIGWIPVSRTGMTPVVDISCLFYCLMRNSYSYESATWMTGTNGNAKDPIYA